MGQTVQIPLIKGESKSYKTLDWLDALPVNMVPVAKAVRGVAGYLRMWPGLDKVADVAGVSRGVQWNTVKEKPYRVMGEKLYLGGDEVGDVAGLSRVSMANSRTSQAVAANGELKLYRYDGEVKTFTNWPDEVIPASSEVIYQFTHRADDDKVTLSASQTNGSLVISITPTNGANVRGAPLILSESDWANGKSQSAPEAGFPYITNCRVAGVKFPGATITIIYTFNANGGNASDISEIQIKQEIPESTREGTKYDWGSVLDVCRVKGRYIFSQEGTDTFWISDIEDESHPDRDSAAYRAESMPDGILALREWRDYLMCFGPATIEFFALTGDSTNEYQVQPSYQVRQGVCGQFAVCEYLDNYAIVSSVARGQASVYIVQPGQMQEIATQQIKVILAEYSATELSATVCERLYFKNHKFLIVHLPRHTLVYDASTSEGIGQPAWSILKSGLGDAPYRAIDFMNETDVITCGDKLKGITGKMTEEKSSQYGDDAELILYTPLLQAENGIVSDFEIDANTGAGSLARVAVSTTEDGINYGPERLINWNEANVWLSRTIWKRIGRVRTQLGFKIRVVGAVPATMANCSVRID